MRAPSKSTVWLILSLIFLPGLLSAPAVGWESGRIDPFRIEGKPPTLAYVTASPDPVEQDLLEVPMIAQLATVLGTIEPRSMTTLRRAISRDPISADQCTPDRSIGTLHLSRNDQSISYELFRISDTIVALRSNPDPSNIFGISIAAFDRLGITLPYPEQDSQASQPDPNQLRFILPHPYVQSKIVLDRRTLRARVKQTYPELTRKLEDETFRVRLPKNYNPSFPAGVLVWISPMPDGRIPTIFEPALDELGFIAIGVDNNGNKRLLTDRLQNHFDSIASLATHYRIDPQRVYLTGMSGGGRCSGILQLAFPDQFAGAVPIVGLDTYHNAPTGQPGMHWPARLGRPAGRWMKLLKERRIAGITGTNDFNEPEMVIRQGLLERDGIEMRLDIIEGMAHAMPPAKSFTKALKWVDLPRRDAMVADFKEAKERMSDYIESFGDQPPESPAARKQLIEIITLAPWTEPATKACALLGYQED